MSGWFALVDTAQDPSLFGIVKACSSHDCLFSGDLDPALAAASPHLVGIVEGEPLLAAWNGRGGGRNWGILCETALELDPLRRHFKKFLNAKLPDGTVALFRFYDPRVFNTYIRACSVEELGPWFKGVRQYCAEDKAGAIHHYSLRGGRLYDGDVPAS